MFFLLKNKTYHGMTISNLHRCSIVARGKLGGSDFILFLFSLFKSQRPRHSFVLFIVT